MRETGTSSGAVWSTTASGGGAGRSAAPPLGRAATRVLIVDDGAPAREGLCALLATFPDIEVIAAVHDGPEAVGLAQATHPDVVVLDARLPLVDGLSVTRLVKAQAGKVRVIVLSYCSAYRDAALHAGADAFLVKGGPFEELVGAIRQR